jgi:hypothetical protein
LGIGSIWALRETLEARKRNSRQPDLNLIAFTSYEVGIRGEQQAFTGYAEKSRTFVAAQ